MNLPPKLRQLQQSAMVQTVIVPSAIAGLGAAMTAILAASHGDLTTLDGGMFKTALGVGGFAALTYVAGIWQHGIGSASFHTDGTPNKAVEKVAEETK